MPCNEHHYIPVTQSIPHIRSILSKLKSLSVCVCKSGTHGVYKSISYIRI